MARRRIRTIAEHKEPPKAPQETSDEPIEDKPSVRYQAIHNIRGFGGHFRTGELLPEELTEQDVKRLLDTGAAKAVAD